MPASAIHIDDLCWPTTRYSDVLRIDRRVCAQALETVPSMERNGARVWHIRDGMPAIFRRLHGLDAADGTADPKKLPPKDRLDHYRAERERIKLAQEVRILISAAEIEQESSLAFKMLAEGLDGIRTNLEHHCGLPHEAVSLVEQIIDKTRDQLYDQMAALMSRE
jgi:hypothetical protein